MATGKKDPPKKDDDPYADWSDDEKAEWESSSKQRARHTEEIRGGILEGIKEMFFNDEDGGAVDDEDGDDEEAGDKDPPVKSNVPWFERTIFGKKAK